MEEFKKRNVRIEIVGGIKTKQRPRARVVNNKYARVYTPQDTINYENYVKTEYQRQTKEFFGDRPLFAEINCYFKLPKDKEEKFKDCPDLVSNIACVVNKDCDNIAKIILDSLNGIAYCDDKQIIRLEVHKWYTTEKERIVVNLQEANSPRPYEEIILVKNYRKAKEKLDKYINKLLENNKSSLEKLNVTEQRKWEYLVDNKYEYISTLIQKLMEHFIDENDLKEYKEIFYYN